MCYPDQGFSDTISALPMLNAANTPSMGNPNAGVGVPIYRPGDGGYVRGMTQDRNDPGAAPEGYFSQYRFNPDGQIVGSADGKTFNPIAGLQINMDAVRNAYHDAPTQTRPQSPFAPSIAEQLYGRHANREGFETGIADGGLIKDFRVDADGKLYARINSGAVGSVAPTNLSGVGDPGGFKGVEFEGYVPIDNFPLTEMEGNFGEGGRSAFFSPDGAIALNAGRNEEFPGLLTAYTRKRIQELKQADDVNLLTGTRGGG